MNTLHKKQFPEVNDGPYSIIGMVVNQPFYFVAGLLHRDLGLNFKRVKNFEFYNDKDNTLEEFSTYLYRNDTDELLYLMFNNDRPLIKGLKDVDYLLMIIGRDCAKKSDDLVKSILKQKKIMTCRILYQTQNSDGDITYSNKIETEEAVQLSLFDGFQSDTYARIKNKRREVLRSTVIDDTIMENLRSDLEINLCSDSV